MPSSRYLPTPFPRYLQNVRERSRWPTVVDFARQVGHSPGGIKKYERGDRLPSKEDLDAIIRFSNLTAEEGRKLEELWNQAKAEQVGVVVEKPSVVDPDELAVRVHAEVLYVLKQEGIRTSEKTARVLASRIRMITKAVSEKS